jgi:hypothetical protein
VFIECGVSGWIPLAKRPEGAKLLAGLKSGDVVLLLASIGVMLPHFVPSAVRHDRVELVTCDSESPAMSTNLFVILVHGTWGRGFFPNIHLLLRKLLHRRPRWFEPGSQFRSILAAELNTRSIDTEISFIEWSGSNSFSEREAAAIALASMLDDIINGNHTLPILVVAHSHGGNIAVRALDHMPAPPNNLYLATVVTPFLELFSLRLSDSIRRAVSTMKLLVMILAALLSIFFMGYFFPWLLKDHWGSVPPDITINRSFHDLLEAEKKMVYLFLVIGAPFIILIFLFQRTAKLTSQFIRRRFEYVKSTSSQESLIKLGSRFIAIRAIDDEASFTLAIGGIGARLSTIWLSLLGFLRPDNVNWVLSGSAIMLLMATFEPKAEVLGATLVAILEIAFFVGPLVFLASPLLVLFLVILSGVLKALVYGRELILFGFLCEVNAQSAPDGFAVSAMTLQQVDRAGRLRHSLYDEPECPKTVAAWIAARLPISTPQIGDCPD